MNVEEIITKHLKPLSELQSLLTSNPEQGKVAFEEVLKQVEHYLIREPDNSSLLEYQAQVQRFYSIVLGKTGEYSEAFKNADASMHYWKKTHNVKMQILVAITISNIYRFEDKINESLEIAEFGKKLAEEIDDTVNLIRIENNIAIIYGIQGESEKSLKKLLNTQALINKLDKDLETPDLIQLEIVNLLNIGIIYKNLGEFGLSSSFLKRALEKNIIGTRPEILANIYSTLGDIEVALKNYKLGIQYFSEALTIHKSHSLHHYVINTLNYIASTYIFLKDFVQAEVVFKEGFTLAEKYKLNVPLGSLFLCYARFWLAQKDACTAEKTLLKAIELLEPISDVGIKYEVHSIKAEIYGMNEAYSEALAEFHSAKTITQDAHLKAEECSIWDGLARVYEKLGDWKSAYDAQIKARDLESQLSSERSKYTLTAIQVLHEVVTARYESEMNRLKLLEVKSLNDKLIALNEERSDFYSIVVHDLKNPLNTILLHTDYFMKTTGSYTIDEAVDSFRDIRQLSKGMLELVQNLLDINRIEENKLNIQLRRIAPSQLLQKLHYQFFPQTERKEQILTITNESKEFILGDNLLNSQILENLVSNAIKFSPVKSEISIYVTECDDILRFAIQDSGPGISEEEQEMLFQKFTKLSPRPTGGENSTGLGLFIVKKLAQIVSANVWCKSELRRGTTFYVDFPIYRESAAATAEDQAH